MYTRTYHLDPNVLGFLGALAIEELNDKRKSKRRSAVIKLVRLLRIGGLFPTESEIVAFGLGVDRNGEKVIMLEVDTPAKNGSWEEFERRLPG